MALTHCFKLEVFFTLIRSKCLPALLYGFEACPLRKSDIGSLDFVQNRSLMKLLQTNNIDIVNKCKKLQFIHTLTASDTSKTVKITKR